MKPQVLHRTNCAQVARNGRTNCCGLSKLRKTDSGLPTLRSFQKENFGKCERSLEIVRKAVETKDLSVNAQKHEFQDALKKLESYKNRLNEIKRSLLNFAGNKTYTHTHTYIYI